MQFNQELQFGIYYHAMLSSAVRSPNDFLQKVSFTAYLYWHFGQERTNKHANKQENAYNTRT